MTIAWDFLFLGGGEDGEFLLTLNEAEIFATINKRRPNRNLLNRDSFSFPTYRGSLFLC